MQQRRNNGERNQRRPIGRAVKQAVKAHAEHIHAQEKRDKLQQQEHANADARVLHRVEHNR